MLIIYTLRANDTLTVSGSANITAASFNNSGNITANNSFNATVDSFSNEAGARITAGECNIVLILLRILIVALLLV